MYYHVVAIVVWSGGGAVLCHSSKLEGGENDPILLAADPETVAVMC